MTSPLSRRRMLMHAGAGLAAAASSLQGTHAEDVPVEQSGRNPPPLPEPFRLTLNGGTLLGHKLSIEQEVDIAAEAGWQAIEAWTRKLTQHVDGGGTLADLRKRLDDRGLVLASAIGFPRWAVEDPTQRAEGLETMRREMDMVAQLGGSLIACPPAGINGESGMDLREIAGRYRTVLELGHQAGVVPQLEIWGSAQTLSTLSEAVFVAAEAGHPDACLLLDVYHLYRGGSDFEGLKLLSGASMHCFHLNDYPATPPREELADADRVLPGDGAAPLVGILRTLRANGFSGFLSLELFNRELWQRDPAEVAREGFEKSRAVVEASRS